MSYSYRSSKTSSVANRHARTRTGQRKGNQKQRGQYIDPSRFIKVATATEAPVYKPQNAFTDFSLHELLKSNLVANGYITPSPIQDQAIPAGLKGHDVIGVASTGTGKTAAFALPVLQNLLSNTSSAALIVAPTRELAQQIESECRTLAKGSGLSGAVLIGGSSMTTQLRDLRHKPRIVIGTPGRLKDHLRRGTLLLRNFNIVVLDEVDRMLDMGFVNDVTEILGQLSNDRQAFFFSATMDNRVRALINNFTSDPYTVSLKASSASDSVHQNVIRYQGNIDKLDKLHELLLKEEATKVIVFEETKHGVERLSKELLDRGFSADAIHGGKSQGQRQRALARLKKHEVKVLVATDVAARGLDIPDITHVVNYSIPKVYDDYIHRIGRAGRAGNIGHALTFIAR